MGKKRKSQRVKQPPPQSPPLPPRSPVVDSASGQATPGVESLENKCRQEGMRAISTLTRGDSKKALKIIRESISRHPDSAYLHYIEAAIHLGRAAEVGQCSHKLLKHLTEASRSAELAVNLVPNSFEYAYFLATVLQRLAMINAEKWDDKLIDVCECAFKIENPVLSEGVYPIKLYIRNHDEDVEMGKLNKELKIQFMKQEMMKILEKSQSRKNLKLTAKSVEGETKEDDYKSEEDIKGLQRRKMEIAEIMEEFEEKETRYRQQKFEENAEKIEKYKTFWSNTLSFEEKRGFLKVDIGEFSRHLKSLKNNFVAEVYKEALGFAKQEKTWKFLECCHCSKKYGDPQVYRDHINESHLANSMSIIQSVTENEIPNDWIQIIENDVWKPVDIDEAIKIIVNQMNSESVTTDDSWLYAEKGLDVCKDYVQSPIGERYIQKWPLCDDVERAESLERIHGMCRLLLRSRFLAPSHVLWAIQYAIHQLECKFYLSQFGYHGLENPKVICFLEASELKVVIGIFENLLIALGLCENFGVNISINDSPREHSIKVRVIFNGDFSYLHLDERILWGELNNANNFDAFACDDSEVTSAVDVCKDVALPDSNEIVSWLYLCPMIREYMNLWAGQRDSLKGKKKRVLEVMMEECSHLRANHDRISKLSSKMEGVLAVERLCLEEIKKREQCPEHVPQFDVNLLKKRRTDLQGNDDDASRTESDIISDVLNEAILDYGFGQPELKGCIPDYPIELIDNSITLALEHLRLRLLTDMVYVDTIILQRIDAIKKYELLLEKLSASDYRLIIVPLLKSFLQARLQDLYNKDIMKKYDAQTESLLAELALDALKNTDKGCQNVRQKQENNKTKKNKKKKTMENREAKKSKVKVSAKHHELPQKDEQEDNQNCEIGESADELKQLIATDERLLEEKLEHQRQFEHEASLRVNVLGSWLGNEAADSFLNTVVKSLWHLREFREKLISNSQSIHKHIGNPCVVCALFDAFISIGSAEHQGEAVAPTALRSSLTTHCSNKNIFQEGQMNDASQFLQIILKSLHESLNEVNPEFESEDEYKGILDCCLAGCFVHRIFGMDHYESINCVHCYAESGHQKYTSLSLNVNAYDLRMKKDTHVGSSFDVLLKLAKMNGELACKVCGHINQIYHTLWCLPHVFTIVLGWQKDDERAEATSMTLSALYNELDLSILFQGYPPDNIYFLVSMVCCSGDGQHYICFLDDHQHEKYVWCDGKNVEVIGSWDEVVSTCNKLQLHPKILFFVHKCSIYFDP